MLDVWMRPVYQRWFLEPVANYLLKHVHCDPLLITALAGLSGLFAAMFTGFNLSILAIFFLILSGFLDTLDGTIARIKFQASSFGALLDILMDRFVEAAIICGFYWQDPTRAWPCLVMLMSVLLCVSSFLTVGIFTANSSEKSFHYSPGLMERAEAFIFFILMIIFPGYFTLLAWTFIILVFLTAGLRVMEFRREFN